MDADTRDRLLALNRSFYEDVAEPFHATRLAIPAGFSRLLEIVPAHEPLRVLDAGCGNGRLAVALSRLNRPIAYCGVDGNGLLLDYAQKQTSQLEQVDAFFIQADLADPNWDFVLAGSNQHFDLVACLATLQHLPGYELRSQLVRILATHLAPHGRLALTGWQFMDSPRLASRRIDWSEVGVDAAHVEPGDALLPWKQDVYAIRYVHQVDEDEMRSLAQDAGLRIVECYRADGKENNLNLYTIMEAAYSA